MKKEKKECEPSKDQGSRFVEKWRSDFPPRQCLPREKDKKGARDVDPLRDIILPASARGENWQRTKMDLHSKQRRPHQNDFQGKGKQFA